MIMEKSRWVTKVENTWNNVQINSRRQYDMPLSEYR